jgi:hypothetical protein
MHKNVLPDHLSDIYRELIVCATPPPIEEADDSSIQINSQTTTPTNNSSSDAETRVITAPQSNFVPLTSDNLVENRFVYRDTDQFPGKVTSLGAKAITHIPTLWHANITEIADANIGLGNIPIVAKAEATALYQAVTHPLPGLTINEVTGWLGIQFKGSRVMLGQIGVATTKGNLVLSGLLPIETQAQKVDRGDGETYTWGSRLQQTIEPALETAFVYKDIQEMRVKTHYLWEERDRLGRLYYPNRSNRRRMGKGLPTEIEKINAQISTKGIELGQCIVRQQEETLPFLDGLLDEQETALAAATAFAASNKVSGGQVNTLFSSEDFPEGTDIRGLISNPGILQITSPAGKS